MQLIVDNLDRFYQCKSFYDTHNVPYDSSIEDYIFFDGEKSVKGYKITFNPKFEDLGYFDFTCYSSFYKGDNFSQLDTETIIKMRNNGLRCSFCGSRIRAYVYFIKVNDNIVTLGKSCRNNLNLKSYYPNSISPKDKRYKKTNFTFGQLVSYVESFNKRYVPSSLVGDVICKTPKEKFIDYTTKNDLPECSEETLEYYTKQLNSQKQSEFIDNVIHIINDPFGIHVEASGKVLSVLFNIKEHKFSGCENVSKLENVKCKLEFIKAYKSFSQFSDITYKHIFTSDVGTIVWYTTSEQLFDKIGKSMTITAKNFNVKNNQILIKRPKIVDWQE